MALSQQKFREIVFQMLYSFDVGAPDGTDISDLLAKELKVSRSATKEALERVRFIQERLEKIDAQIQEHSTTYAVDRIHDVERNILRLGVFEMLHDPSIPPKVAIAEAIRLARKFGTPEGASFVNGVLDNFLEDKGEA